MTDSILYLDNPRWCSALPWRCSGKESACQYRKCRRCRFDPWIGKIPWERKWQPTPVFLPGKPQGQRSLVGYSPWDFRVQHDGVTTCAILELNTNLTDGKTEAHGEFLGDVQGYPAGVCQSLDVNPGSLALMGFPGGSNGERICNPLQHSCPENPMDREAWRATAHRVTQSQTQLSNTRAHTHTHTHTLSLAPHLMCSTLPNI